MKWEEWCAESAGCAWGHRERHSCEECRAILENVSFRSLRVMPELKCVYIVLVTIRDEKVRLQLLHIKWNLPDTMSAIDNTHDPLIPTDSREPLKGKPYTGITDDSVEHSSTNLETLLASLTDNFTESALELVLGDREFKAHFSKLEVGVLCQGDDAFLHGSIHTLEVNKGLSGLEVQIV